MIYELEELESIVRQLCNMNNVDYDLVYSMITVESNWNTFACRYEPNVDKYVHNAHIHAQNNNITGLTETMLQKTSFGLLQTCGFLVRDLGFKGMITELCDPHIGVLYGIKYLKKKLEQYGDESAAVAAYNAGTAKKLDSGMFVNQRYVDRVFSVLQNCRKLN